MRVFASLSLAVLALASFHCFSPSAIAPKAQSAPQVRRWWRRRRRWAGTVGITLPGRSTDKDIRAAADQLVATGMKDAGYIYVNIDDTWEGERDANGVLHPNAKFPDMKALADYVHSKGLKIGIYSSPGPKTCAGYEGSLGHEEQDAKMYAAWGIDYLKYDLCSFIPDVMEKQAPNDKAAQMRLMIAAYDKMDKALKATGRPIVYSLLPIRLGRGLGVGARGSAATCGAPPATSTRTGTASTPSSASRRAWKNTPAPATGTIPTCSKWATASSRWPKTARTFRCGPCWPRRCWPATTCPT